MNARCKKCGHIMHFGGRGSRLKDLRCCGQKPEQVFMTSEPSWQNRQGEIYPYNQEDRFKKSEIRNQES